jgi:hypothetical protein
VPTGKTKDGHGLSFLPERSDGTILASMYASHGNWEDKNREEIFVGCGMTTPEEVGYTLVYHMQFTEEPKQEKLLQNRKYQRFYLASKRYIEDGTLTKVTYIS